MTRVIVPETPAERLRTTMRGVAKHLQLERRIPDHLRKLELPVKPDLVEALGAAVILTVLNVGRGRNGETLIKRPMSAWRTRERWPSHREAIPPREVVLLFEMEPLLQP